MSTRTILASEVKLGKKFCDLLKREIDVKIINNVAYANFDTSEKWLPKEWLSGKVLFEALDIRKLNAFRYGKSVCAKSNIEFKILLPTKDKNGFPMFQLLTFDGNKEFDLAVKSERAKALILSMQPFIKGNPDGIDYVRMTNVQDNAQEKREKRKKIQQAFEIIEEMHGKELQDFARLLVIVTPGETDVVIKNRLEDLAETNPELIIQEFSQSDRVYKQVFMKAKNLNVITFRQDTGFVYNGNSLGYNEFDVIYNFKDNLITFQSICNRIKELDTQSINRLSEAAEEMKVIEEIESVNKGDQSISDIQRKQDAIDSGESKGVDMAAFMRQMTASMNNIFEEKLNPLKEMVDNVKKENDKLHQIFEQTAKGKPAVEEKDEDEFNVSAAVYSELNDLNNGLFEGKPVDDWKLKDLKAYCVDKLTEEEFNPIINLKKAELFDALIKFKINKIEHEQTLI